MPQKLTRPTEDQIQKIDEYCERHGISPTVAGRIAWERLLAKPPAQAEISRAKVPLGNPATLRQNQPG